jgi:hypothetical protein
MLINWLTTGSGPVGFAKAAVSWRNNAVEQHINQWLAMST